MIQAFVLSLIFGPLAVTLALWLLYATVASRAQKEAVVHILVDRRPRSQSRDDLP
ncbi:MAG: hypothetical protein JO312_00400, partial [Hyphomicrobiales bacterium]|nr:hypothetical protein [Hyphomicrobiales bacterium]